MGKKFTLFAFAFLMTIVSAFAGSKDLPVIDAQRQAKMKTEVNSKLMMRSKAKAQESFAKVPKLQQASKFKANQFNIGLQAESVASNVEGLQVYNADDIYDTWWKFDVATAKSTALWNHYLLEQYSVNAGWVEDDEIFAVAVETGYILRFKMSTGEYNGYLAMGGSDYSTSILHSAYDAKSDKVYVYTYNADGQGMLFQTYNPDTGAFTLIKTEEGEGSLAKDPLVTMAFNPLDGFIYAITLYNEKWIKIDPATGNYTEIAKFAFSPAYFTQAMVYSPNDHAFVYVGIDVNEATFRILVDPSTGDILDEVEMYDEAEYAILYCGDQAIQDDAPSAPVIESIVLDGFSSEGVATIVMPTKTFDGDDLTGNLILSVVIDGSGWGSYSATPGQTIEVPFGDIREGVHVMKALCYSGDLEGAYTEKTFFVGVDSPAAPQNVVLTETMVSWDAVSEGQNGGGLESSVITYNVYINGVLQNEAPIESTSYEVTLDTSSIAKVQAEVEAVCGSKVSSRGASNMLIVGVYSLPLDLQITQDALQYVTVVDANEDGTTWKWCEQHNAFEYEYSEYHKADDWAIFHKTTFPTGKQLYRIDVDMTRYNSSEFTETFEIGISKTGKAEDMIIVVPETILSNPQGVYGGQFKLEEAGDYYIGIRATSAPDQYYIRLNKLSVSMSDAPVTVPEACTDAVATAADYGVLKAIVEVTLPTMAINGETLDVEKDVIAHVHSNVASASASGKPGERVSIEVTTEQGVNNLKIVPENEAGLGSESTISVYTGVDLPAPAILTSLEISEDNRTMTFSWETSTVGSNGGFVDPAFVTYLILIYYPEQDYWFTEAGPGYEGTQYSYTLPEGRSLQSVSLAIGSQNAAGYNGEGPIVTASLGMPYAIPMEENFEDFTSQYAPMTIEHPAEEYSGTWTLGNPSSYVPGSSNSTGSALISYATEDGETYSQLALPKFTAKGEDEVLVEVEAYLYDDMADAVVYVRGYENEVLPLGTITKGENDEGWSTFEFILPEDVLSWEWAELIVKASFTGKDQYLLIGGYSIHEYLGVNDIPASDVVIYGLQNAIQITGLEKGEPIEVYAIDGRCVAVRRAEGKDIKIEIEKGIYVTCAGNKTAKVTVR